MEHDPFEPNRRLGRGRRGTQAALALGGITARTPRATRVDYLPGRALTITWTAERRVGDGPRTLGQVVEHVAARPLAGVDPVGQDAWGHPVHVFAAEADPALPGFARALDPEEWAKIRPGADVQATSEPVTTRVVGHEPTRRAVVEVRGSAGCHRLEVLPPARAANGQLRHQLLAGRISVPACEAVTDDGILALRPIPGASLEATVLEGRLFPSLRTIDEMLDHMPQALAEQTGAVGMLERVGGHVQVLSNVLPDRVASLQSVVASLGPFADRDPGPLVAHHGDLRPSILTVRTGELAGLTDTVGVGEGYRIDDLASLIGHLVLLGWLHRSGCCEHLAATWLDEVGRSGDHPPAAMRARIAAVILGSAVGCFRRQDADWRNGARQRIALAERWVESAQAAARVERGGATRHLGGHVLGATSERGCG